MHLTRHNNRRRRPTTPWLSLHMYTKYLYVCWKIVDKQVHDDERTRNKNVDGGSVVIVVATMAVVVYCSDANWILIQFWSLPSLPTAFIVARRHHYRFHPIPPRHKDVFDIVLCVVLWRRTMECMREARTAQTQFDVQKHLNMQVMFLCSTKFHCVYMAALGPVRLPPWTGISVFRKF